MFYCKKCKSEFENPETVFETYGLSGPPFEKHTVCPYCSSHDYVEKIVTHCKYCGAKLLKGKKLYCNTECKQKGEFLWNKQQTNKQLMLGSPIFAKVREIDSYNKNTGSRLSYGKYIALTEKRKKGKK